MGKDEEKRDKDEAGAGPTRSFDGSVKGAGEEIGAFRIERELGRGAAGVVYLAHDTKLDRQVAIKSLPAELMENPKARSRFRREAKVLASLNHPNIATIHEQLEEAEGVGYLVLEYVPGQTLAERIARGPIKLEETLTIALQIAEAVAAAHEHDVIHRDLKPGNIKITPEGKVKVLDFGLAKAVGGEVTEQQSTITEPGRVIGTPAYMSPEQARGRDTDKRSDIWSFGCVLYEMLTGQITFKGETISDTLANVLQTEPEWELLPENTPANILLLLRRCLEKDHRRRLRDIGDASIEISETLNLPATAPPVTISPAAIPQPAGRRRWIGVIAGLIFVAIAASMITWNLRRPAPRTVSRFTVSLPKNQMLHQVFSGIAVSPDGKRLVYVGGSDINWQFYLREVDQVEGKELPGTSSGHLPFFSPDGRWLGFFGDGKLKKVFLDGGKPITLCDAKNPSGASWGADGTIFFTPAWTGGLWKISADGGVPEVVTTPDKGEQGHWFPEVLPGGEAVLFTIWSTSLDDVRVAVLSRKTGKWQTLVTGGSHARYVPTGHLVYAQSGTLVAAPFDPKQLKVGEPRPVLEGIKQYPGSGYAPFSFSRDGSLYYIRGGEWLARRPLVWVNRQGEEVEQLPLPPGAYLTLCLSPDGKRFAFTKFDRGAFNIWLYEFPSGPAKQLTFESSNFLPVWTPDGMRLTFTSFRHGPFSVYWVPVDGSGTEEPLVTGPYDQMATSWSPDGKALLFVEANPDTSEDIYLLSIEDGNTPRPLLHESWNEGMPIFSPDGNWIAYISDAEGRMEVYVTPYPGLGKKEKVSIAGGYDPVWSRDGKELFYRCDDKMMAATIKTEPEFRIASSEVLFEWHMGLGRNYDVSPDGQRFLMVKESEGQPATNQLIVVVNWFEELKRLVPVEEGR